MLNKKIKERESEFHVPFYTTSAQIYINLAFFVLYIYFLFNYINFTFIFTIITTLLLIKISYELLMISGCNVLYK